MKIEKISDNQFRCILSREDLQDRHIKLSELAYGSQKARDFFQDIVLQANKEYGFEPSDEPLMIEAIPLPDETMMLLVTKVENPEELDPHFSNFTPDRDEESEQENDSASNPFAESVLDVFTQLGNSILGKLLGKNTDEALPEKQETKRKKKASGEARREKHSQEEALPEAEVQIARERAFRFPTLERAAEYSRTVRNRYHGSSVLYRNPADRCYYLVLYSEGADVEEYNIACNIACEYGTMLDKALTGLYEEHYSKVLPENALEVLTEV